MSDLNALLTDTTRPTVVAELTQLADRTVANQSGLTGMALKSAVGAAKKADGEAVSKGINKFLPQLVEELTPFWNDYNSAESAGFGNFLASRETELSDRILAVGDSLSGQGPAAIQKVYSALRGKLSSIIGPTLPELGDIIERNAR
ncbi:MULTISPECIES: DUF6918 family protein [unclassified Corynebacterium]|uniref:DUF6918 family protein n=1 Tax=unclassified Corynebacterium TaxID=2624378 RepID=UPI002A912D03|nr:hypothetical protein [Corynebacterium sp.]MDY5785559.1 hypothetical protein [Corynebacterium sp.]